MQIKIVLEGRKEISSNRCVREKRDQRILNRGKAELVISDNDVSTRAQSFLMPELAHISTVVSYDRELSFDEMLLFLIVNAISTWLIFHGKAPFRIAAPLEVVSRKSNEVLTFTTVFDVRRL
ncbi:hypothetical protein IFM46972_10749 [Aspergillus udagawae]|uniref:Uncharacterized protein n=1 Tax=Aspergillus udagawae TaxID=91492 RepID=A0A8H3SE27_9EURO|nr:hypothetical protein IFM46972_10749 [Aspergillus udagawae]